MIISQVSYRTNGPLVMIYGYNFKRLWFNCHVWECGGLVVSDFKSKGTGLKSHLFRFVSTPRSTGLNPVAPPSMTEKLWTDMLNRYTNKVSCMFSA